MAGLAMSARTPVHADGAGDQSFRAASRTHARTNAKPTMMMALTTTTVPMTMPMIPAGLLAAPPRAEAEALIRDIDPTVLANEEFDRSGYVALGNESIAMKPNTTVSSRAMRIATTVTPCLLSHISICTVRKD